jgi:hypothetical protein
VIGMTELISCAMCNRDGRLRLDTKPERVEHDRGKTACVLPPRAMASPVPAPRWADRYPSPYRHAS